MGTKLFPASTSLSDADLHARFEGFIVEHPEAVGIAQGVSPEDLDLEPARAFRAPAGKLELLRFDQRYRGFPVYGPDGTVRVTLAPGGAIAFDGAIVDGREEWANVEQQASEDMARRSILAHAEARSGLPLDALQLAGLRRVAVPGLQRIGWVGTVRSGLGHVATIVVDADPDAGSPLPILHVERIEAAALTNEVDIELLGEDPASDVFTPPQQSAGLGQLFDGSPLRGSMRGTDFILGTERVVAYDASGATSTMDLELVPPLTSPSMAFDAMPGTIAYDVQNHYVRVQSFYAFADRYMAGVWESLVAASSIPPGELAPRVMLWIQPGFEACGDASFCASYIHLDGMSASGIEDEYEHPLGGPSFESLGTITIESDGASAHVLAHEFGHMVDLFAAPHVVDQGLGCAGVPGCAPSCQLDTTEEAPTLREAAAQLFAIAAMSTLYPMASFDECDPLYAISLGGDGAPHNDACRPDGEPYSHFLPVSCPPGVGSCDHDFDVGMELGQPTGLCSPSNGYRTDSIHQAFWELFHGQSCAAMPPYTCAPLSLPAGMTPSDAFMPAFLYALRVDAKSFRQFVDAFVTYVSCNLGSDVYEEVNAVLCHHDLRACDATPPTLCENCGNNVREGAEACDGIDLGGRSCPSGGVIACDSSCNIDESMCDPPDTGLDATDGGLDETGAAGVGTDDPGLETSTGDWTSGRPGSTGGSDGCGCHSGPGGSTSLAMVGLGLMGLAGTRRRRRSRAIAALVLVLAASSMQGCSDPTVGGTDGASDSAGEASSASEPSTTGDGGPSESSGDPGLPDWALGVFSDQSDEVGTTVEHPVWYAWSNIEIAASGAVIFERYVCSESRERQEFRWTLADDRQSLSLQPVPPAELFTFGSDEFISEVVIEPGGSCDALAIRYFNADAMQWIETEYLRGEVCAAAADPKVCTFTFEWCDGVTPTPCRD